MGLEEIQRTLRFATSFNESGVVPVFLILDIYTTSRNKKFRICRMDCSCHLVGELLNFGKRHLLGRPAATFASHAFGFVKDFPSHERLVVTNRLYHRIEHVVDKGLGACIFKQIFIRGNIELVISVKSPLIRLHQVMAEKAHGNHHAVFFGDIQSLLHIGNGIFLEPRNQMRRLIDFRALAHVIEEPPTDCITACGTRAFDSLAPSVFVQRSIAHVRVVITPGEVRTREENLLAVVE